MPRKKVFDFDDMLGRTKPESEVGTGVQDGSSANTGTQETALSGSDAAPATNTTPVSADPAPAATEHSNAGLQIPVDTELQSSANTETQVSVNTATQDAGNTGVQTPVNTGIQESRNKAAQVSGGKREARAQDMIGALLADHAGLRTGTAKKATFDFTPEFARALKRWSVDADMSMRDLVVKAVAQVIPVEYLQEYRKPGTQKQ